MGDIDTTVKEMQDQIDQCETDVKVLIASSKKEQAKIMLRNKQLAEQRLKALSDKRFFFQKALFDLEDAATNVSMNDTMKKINSVNQLLKVDIDELIDAKNEMELTQQERNEVNEVWRDMTTETREEAEQDYEKMLQEYSLGSNQGANLNQNKNANQNTNQNTNYDQSYNPSSMQEETQPQGRMSIEKPAQTQNNKFNKYNEPIKGVTEQDKSLEQRLEESLN